MTEQEKINNDFTTKFAVNDEKFDSFLREMKDFKDEMRDRDNQRHAEMSEIRSLFDSINKYIFIQTVTIFFGSAIIFFALLLK